MGFVTIETKAMTTLSPTSLCAVNTHFLARSVQNICNDASWVGVLVDRRDHRVQIVAPKINNERLRPANDQYELFIEHGSYHTRAL